MKDFYDFCRLGLNFSRTVNVRVSKETDYFFLQHRKIFFS